MHPKGLPEAFPEALTVSSYRLRVSGKLRQLRPASHEEGEGLYHARLVKFCSLLIVISAVEVGEKSAPRVNGKSGYTWTDVKFSKGESTNPSQFGTF
jgi:hypothetical protein